MEENTGSGNVKETLVCVSETPSKIYKSLHTDWKQYLHIGT